MKKTLLAFILISAGAQAQTTHPSGVTGCIARWDFNGPASTNLPDVSSNNHGAVAYDLTSVNGFRNRISSAMHFNGLTSYAQAPNSTQLNPQQLSVVALIRFTGFYSGDCQGNNIIVKGNSYYTPGTWALTVDDQNYDHSCGIYSPGFDQMNFATQTVESTPLTPADFLAQNNWYLLVTTYDGNILTRYQ